ncbi:stalk domain-containing protein [Desulforamulus profundi]|uniref:stalk domain-containing protein n=1 Tax=Desulforamulus profundi TaxID=1383067 RepID=UPI001EE5698B|nr:phosphodiester glycosidase family protein [Desulforamulus profundi]
MVEPVFGSTQIPAGGYVLSGWGGSTNQLMAVSAGARARVITELPQEWSNLRHVLSAGPLLVEGGLPVDQAVNEGLWGKVLKPAPRTALGVNAQGKVLLVVVDGRQDGSAGLTLEELSYLMMDLGAVRAVALDGGGSSEIWVKGKILNNPSDKKERPLGNGLMIIQQMPVYVDHQRLYLDVAPIIDQGRTLVPMRKIFERLGAEINWDEATKTVTAVKGELKIELTVGKTTAVVNGKNIKLDVPAKVINGRTLVPMRFVGEALGAKVNYVTTNGPAVYIESAEGGSGLAK